MKLKAFILSILIIVLALTACSAPDNTAATIEPIGIAEGRCDGIGDFVWNTDFATIEQSPGAVKNELGNIIVENVEFAGCVGELELLFEDGLLSGAQYSFAQNIGTEAYNNLLALLEEEYGEGTKWDVADFPQPQYYWSSVPAKGLENDINILLMMRADGIVVLSFIN